ncbi:MAG: hypothetical protein LUQ01_00895 [Methanolinea sp.]|nr:hypothetical protein [Methanolinea sp.]
MPLPPDLSQGKDKEMPKNILLTGRPGSGKTTLLQALAGGLAPLCPQGFVTVEIRKSGDRVGFDLVSFSGERRILSRINTPGGPRVGKYGVDVGGFEEFLSLHPLKEASVVLVDEIGKMECLSPLFREWILQALASPIPVVATIARKGTPFIEGIKTRRDVYLLEITMANREEVSSVLHRLVRSLTGGSGEAT